jgi:hypothetical protein
MELSEVPKPELTKVPNPSFPSIRDIQLYNYSMEEPVTMMSMGLCTSAHFETPTSDAMFTFP